jgi:hypothetical protein
VGGFFRQKKIYEEIVFETRERERIKTEKEGERKLGEYQKRTGEKPPRTVVCHCESATVNHREQKHRHEATAERGEHC